MLHLADVQFLCQIHVASIAIFATMLVVDSSKEEISDFIVPKKELAKGNVDVSVM